jgi:hypothetical protein
MIKISLSQSEKVPDQICYLEAKTNGKTVFILIHILRCRGSKNMPVRFHVIYEKYKNKKLEKKLQSFFVSIDECRKWANKKLKKRGYKIRKKISK